nr:nucleolin-like isoform X1 [Rhipicephalus microplus]
MKLKKAQGATGEKSPKNDKEKKLHKANDNDEEVESDTADYLKVSTSPNKKPKVPAPEADSEEDDLEVDDEDDEDDDELDEESPEDEELDDSEGFSDEDDHEVPQLVAAGKAKAKKKPAPKKAALEEGSEDEEDDEEDDSDSDDEEEDDDDDDDGDEDDDEEEDMVKMKKVVKAEQAKRKATDDGPTEQTSKKAKQGDGIPRSLLMDVDEYDKLFLYVGNLPKGCTVEEVKDLSPDIVSVRTNVKLGEKLSFAFVEFKSEADADRNFKRLQKASLRGHPLRVGYRGAKRADLPSNWQEVQNELCVYNLPEGLSQHRVARLFPTATNVSTMAFYTLVTFESKDALLAALKNNACHFMDGNPLKFSYRLKPAGAGKKKKIRRKKLRQRQQQTERGKSSNSKPGKSSQEMSESKKSTVPGKKLFVKQTESPAQAKTSKAKFDAKRKEVKKVAQSAKQRKVQKQ